MYFFSIQSAVILEVRGRDASRYLNARLTNDVTRLKAGQSAFAAALTPHGKTQALFQVGRQIEENSFLLICDGGAREGVVSALKQYIVADRVEVQDRMQELGLCHLAGGGVEQIVREVCGVIELPTEENGFTATDGVYLFCRQRCREWGCDLIGKLETIRQLRLACSRHGGEELTEDQQTRERILANRPAFPTEIDETSIIVEAGLTDMISFDKGCYVGQEVVERIASRGRAPRLLRRLVVAESAVLARGDAVFGATDGGDERAIGKVVSCAPSDRGERVYCFAYIRNDDSYDLASFRIGSRRAEVF